jgi:hypothetical protein
MSATDEILRQLPIDQVAAQLGVDPRSANAAVQQALLAPLVMAYLSKRVSGSSTSSAAVPGSAVSGGPQDLLGGLLGGGRKS